MVISQTLRHGPGQGIRVAMAPLVTDLPIVVLCVVLVGAMAGSSGPLAVISLAGAAFVAWLAWETWLAEPPGDVAPGAAPPAPRSWTRGAAVNALSPHPWLFWIAVGAPTLLASYATGGLPAAGAFVVGFYACPAGVQGGRRGRGRACAGPRGGARLPMDDADPRGAAGSLRGGSRAGGVAAPGGLTRAGWPLRAGATG